MARSMLAPNIRTAGKLYRMSIRSQVTHNHTSLSFDFVQVCWDNTVIFLSSWSLLIHSVLVFISRSALVAQYIKELCAVMCLKSEAEH